VIPFRSTSCGLGNIEQSGLMAFSDRSRLAREELWPAASRGIVSHAFLRSYRVTFDFDRMR
jgi:hypothetical protein